MIAWPPTVIGNTRGNAVWWEGFCESSFRYIRDTLLAGGKLLSQKPKEPQKECVTLQRKGSSSWILFLLRPKYVAIAKSNN